MKTGNLTNSTRLAVAAIALAAAATSFTGCDDDSTIGESIIQDQLAVVVNDTSFTLTGHSIAADTLLSRTVTQIIGSIEAPGYGELSSDFVTQFMPSLALDTVGVSVNEIDSLKLVFSMDPKAFTGDSLAPMGLEVYRLTEDLKTPIYNTFDPAGKYDAANPLGSVMYNATTMGQPDSVQGATVRNIEVTLPRSLGQELYAAFRDNPENYATPSAFSKNVFNGIYVRNSFGSGRIIRIAQTVMRMYYHTTVATASGADSTINHTGSYFAVTPEVITNNNLSLKLASSLKDRAKEGQAIVVAPAGMDVEITFPARDIIDNYRANNKGLGVVNQLTMQIPASTIDNKYNIVAPPHLLLVLSSKKKEFFANGKVNDNMTSFYAAYDGDSHSYTFSGLRDYIVDLMERDQITADDYTFTLVPVTVTTETIQSSYGSTGRVVVTSITPYVATPAMTLLNLANARISLTYSTQTMM